ncbi:MAG TPA: GNAT family N-acetyltransferase [Streptosporangiaceae bacterium]|nr:GNAT family N-acetyltransferase [Streptosporangiaceae bacterium]
MSQPGTPIQVRAARVSDEAELARLDNAAWSPQSGFPSVIRQAGPVFFFADSPPQAHLIAEIGGTLVGYIRLKPASPLPENAHVLGVFGLAVAPEARRRGVATALLTAAPEARRGVARTVGTCLRSTWRAGSGCNPRWPPGTPMPR